MAIVLSCVFVACGKTPDKSNVDHGAKNNVEEYNGIKFLLNDDEQGYSIVEMSYCTDAEIIIPTEYKSKPVTGIGSSAFSGCTNLTNITIPNSVTIIGENAFSGCTGLTSIEIPDSVTSIGAYAFFGCVGLTSVTIPDSVTSIGFFAFQGCTGLSSVTIGNGVTSVGLQSFYGCAGLTSVTIPDSVTDIGIEAFAGCTELTSITFNGTKAQWNAISKGDDWKNNVPSACKVICTDGTINI